MSLRIKTMVVVAACCLCGMAHSTAAAESEERPNFLVIVVDDMGYSDPGCYGGEIDTPHLDRLAADGLRFSQFYNCSRCCQTRASLLTGAYPQRVGMAEFGRTMDTSVPTLAENLRDNGYATAMVGKWHLSELPRTENPRRRVKWMNHELDLGIPFAELSSYPTRRGFDQFYGIIWGVVSHFDPFSLTDGETPVKRVSDDYYFTDAISDRSVDNIRGFADADEPFFLYVAYAAPHWPIQAPAQSIEKYRGRYDDGWAALRKARFRRQQEMGLFDSDVPPGRLSGERRPWDELSSDQQAYQAAKMEVHAAMIDCVDQGIGRIVQELRETGQLENTVVCFLSDNGSSPEIPGPPGYDRHGGTRDGRPALRDGQLRQPANRDKLGSDESYTGIGQTWASATNAPLRFWKAESYEGGCRTPMVVHWPRKIKESKGTFAKSVGHIIDLSPTFLELAGATPQPGTPQDGVSLAGVFQAEQSITDRTLYFEHGDGKAIRKDTWKASKRGGHGWQLFDLNSDPGETDDLAGKNPEVLATLVQQWDAWYDSVFEPVSESASSHPLQTPADSYSAVLRSP